MDRYASMKKHEIVLSVLADLSVPYEWTEHPAAYTMEDMERYGLTKAGMICKNLFLRDFKGKRHFLVVLAGSKKADLKLIASQIGSSALSFASEKRLSDILNLQTGEVTPLGIVNDREHTTEIVFDKELISVKRLGVHPNINTATLWISFDGLLTYINHFGNNIAYITI